MNQLIYLSLCFFLFGCTTLHSKEGEVAFFEGVISTGMMAIGGETTGTTLATEKATYELSFKDKSQLNKFAGKKVRVKGLLKNISGVEIRSRNIVVVDSIELIK